MKNLKDLKQEMLTSDKWIYHTPEDDMCHGTLHSLIDSLWEEILYSLPYYQKKAEEKMILHDEDLCKQMLIDSILRLAIRNKKATRDKPFYFGRYRISLIYYYPNVSYETLGINAMRWG